MADILGALLCDHSEVEWGVVGQRDVIITDDH